MLNILNLRLVSFPLTFFYQKAVVLFTGLNYEMRKKTIRHINPIYLPTILILPLSSWITVPKVKKNQEKNRSKS